MIIREDLNQDSPLEAPKTPVSAMDENQKQNLQKVIVDAKLNEI